MTSEDGDRARIKAGQGEGSPSFSLIDGHMKRQTCQSQDLARVAPMASLAMVLVTVTVCAFTLLKSLEWIPTNPAYGGGIHAYALDAFLFLGFIPLIAVSLAVAFYRPHVQSLAGIRPGLPVLLSAPAAGFFFGALVFSLLQLVGSFLPTSTAWLDLPQLWQKGSLYLGRSTVMTALVLALSVLLPASTHELLHRAVILPAFTGGKGRMIWTLGPSLLAASLALDLPGFAVYLLLALMASRVRMATDSLLASSLSTAGFSLAMLYARPLLTALSQWIFGMPLIDSLKLKLFWASMALILLVLLLIPRAVIQAASLRLYGRGGVSQAQAGEVRSISPLNQLTLLFCLIAIGVCFYFVA